MKKEQETIQTERLLLRGICELDSADIVRWRSDPNVYQYFKNAHELTLEEHLNWYHNRYLVSEVRFDWICLERKSGDRIGVFGLTRDGKSAEISYLLDPTAQHKGYAAEGIQALIQYAQCIWRIEKIKAIINKNNYPSASVVKKLGFRLQNSDGEFEKYLLEMAN